MRKPLGELLADGVSDPDALQRLEDEVPLLVDVPVGAATGRGRVTRA